MIIKEIKRYKIMKEIKKTIGIIGAKYNIKQLLDFIPRWMFLQKNDVDPIFPHNATNFKQLIKDIKYVSPNVDINSLLKELNLTEVFNNAIEQLNDDTINFSIANQYIIKDNSFIIYNIEVINNDDINNYDHEFDLLTFKIHESLYNKMTNNLHAHHIVNNLDDYILSVILRYITLESYNQQLAVLPDFYKQLQTKHGYNFELFASAINSMFPHYCSLYPDIEKHFGSKGRFADYNITRGNYVANPPFDEEVIKNMAIKLCYTLLNNTDPISVFITIPAWDVNQSYGDYEGLTILKKSGLIKYMVKLHKSRAKFFNYYTNKFVHVCDIYFIIIQNKAAQLSPNNNIVMRSIVRDINKFFPINNKPPRGGSLTLMNISSATENLMTHIIILNKGIKCHISPDIIYKNKPVDYTLNIVKKYYDSLAILNYNVGVLGYYNIQTNSNNIIQYNMKLLFDNYGTLDISINNILMIDLTYTCGSRAFIEERLHHNYNALSLFIINNTIDTIHNSFTVNFLFNPKYIHDLITPVEFTHNLLSKQKYDFCFISGNIEYFKLKSVAYYTEQMSCIMYIIECYTLLCNQNINGSFVFLVYTLTTPIYKKILLLLKSYYMELQLCNMGNSLFYIVGKHFLGISQSELNKLKALIIKLITDHPDQYQTTNIYDMKLRKQHHVFMPINTNDKQHHKGYLHNIFNLDIIDDTLTGLINKFTKKAIVNIMKHTPIPA